MLRIITITILILLLLIPVAMVKDLIREREQRQNSAIAEVSSKWGNSQTIKGPVLTVPYRTYTKITLDDDKFKMRENRNYAHFLPEALSIDGIVEPESRYRGIYKVIVYNSKVQLEGEFKKPSFEEWKIDDEDILWDEAFVSLELSDLRGLQETVKLQWYDQDYQFDPGVESRDVIEAGISTRVTFDSSNKNVPFKLALNFNGSTDIGFVPLGKTTTVNLRSSWANPSFTGAFLPDERTISKEGFTAKWEVLHLNRSYPQSFRGSYAGINQSSFGVNLIVPVDTYRKSMRSAKYASLFITLTFIIFFFIQILNRVRIHPIQYIIVGLSLCIFYILLIALSEHLAFYKSYIISSTAIISMITIYSHSIAKSLKLTCIIGGILIILYVFIYTILQLQDHALLLGSIGLFLIMSIVMYLSRKIDWYNIQSIGGKKS
ncbi:cell envelope integrity protein CreD [Saprospiraceae bacterium]|nr:cell envelope integrity protein CreD [Saprospiraceae bacterium]